jgi:hypothetical protein
MTGFSSCSLPLLCELFGPFNVAGLAGFVAATQHDDQSAWETLKH